MKNISPKTKKLVGNKNGGIFDDFLVVVFFVIIALGIMLQQCVQSDSAQPQIIAEAKTAIDENTGRDAKIFKFTPTSQYSIQPDAKKQISDYAEEHGWVSINQDNENAIVFQKKE